MGPRWWGRAPPRVANRYLGTTTDRRHGRDGRGCAARPIIAARAGSARRAGTPRRSAVSLRPLLGGIQKTPGEIARLGPAFPRIFGACFRPGAAQPGFDRHPAPAPRGRPDAPPAALPLLPAGLRAAARGQQLMTR